MGMLLFPWGVRRCVFCVRDASPRVQDWEALEKLLKARFAPEGRELTYKMQLNDRKWNPKESIATYAADVRRLGRLAFPSIPEDPKQTLMIDAFVQGLANEHVKRQVRNSKVTTLAEAQAIAEGEPTLEGAGQALIGKKPTTKLLAVTEPPATNVDLESAVKMISQFMEKTTDESNSDVKSEQNVAPSRESRGRENWRNKSTPPNEYRQREGGSQNNRNWNQSPSRSWD